MFSMSRPRWRQMREVTPLMPPTMAPGKSPSQQSRPPSALSPTPPGGGSSAGMVAGVVVGVVVFLAAVVAFAVFLVKRRRKPTDEEGGGAKEPVAVDRVGVAHSEISSPFPLDNQVGKARTSKRDMKVDGISSETDINPREAIKSSQLQYPSLYTGTSTSSSRSTADNVQPQLVSVGIRAFSYEELSRATNRFSQDNFLGRGGFGSVYRAILADEVQGDIAVAIKVLQDGSFQGEREFLTEINVISRVHHRNLVSLVGYCISGSERLLVYEYLENNNLGFHLLGGGRPVLDWPTRMSIALGAAKGIAYLHEECHPRIIHRDIKSPNILLDSSFGAKVSDFGLAKFVPDNQTHVTTRVIGTLGYLAPEFGSSGRVTEKSDVFSFGVVLLELITGRQALNLVEWGSQMLDDALEDGKFADELIDPKLAGNYDYEEMNRMVTCAALSVHRFPDHRPRMSQVVHVLQGNISPKKLIAEISRPRIRHIA